MSIFFEFFGKLLSCCGICIEEEELREPLKYEQQHISDNFLSTDFYGKAIKVSHSPSAIPNRNYTAVTRNPNAATPPVNQLLRSGKIGSISTNRDPLLGLPYSQKTQLVPQKVNSVIDQKPKDVKSSCKDNLTSTQISLSLVASKNPNTLTTFLSEFRDAVEENESYYLLSSRKAYNGLHSLESSKNKMEFVTMERKIQDYTSLQKILLVGEGDFSFSACLANAFVSATNMVATSLNSEEYLKRYYSESMKNISELKRRGCRVIHKVNANYLSKYKSVNSFLFDRIIYNFPHCGDFSNTIDARRKNQSLIRWFMKHSTKLMKEDGEIHIRHKSNYFYMKWNLKLLATQAGLVLIDVAPFDVSKFNGYNTKYGFEGVRFKSDDNFDCISGCTYKFVLQK